MSKIIWGNVDINNWKTNYILSAFVMKIISKNNKKFNEFEEKTYKKLIKEGIRRTQDWFRQIDEILLKSRDKEILTPKDFKKKTIKCRFGYVEYYRRRYELIINGKKIMYICWTNI